MALNRQQNSACLSTSKYDTSSTRHQVHYSFTKGTWVALKCKQALISLYVLRLVSGLELFSFLSASLTIICSPSRGLWGWVNKCSHASQRPVCFYQRDTCSAADGFLLQMRGFWRHRARRRFLNNDSSNKINNVVIYIGDSCKSSCLHLGTSVEL